MARPLRLEFAGATYHVMCRGNNRAAVFLDDDDRELFLRQVDRVATRFGWRLLAYCLMGNHYHLVLETPEPTLARGMRDINGTYVRHINRKHSRVGHLFQARYRAIVVERGSYLLELMRYVVLNPVRSGFCQQPEAWLWSSYGAVLGHTAGLSSLDSRWVLRAFGPDGASARRAYQRFVLAGIGLPAPSPDATDHPNAPVWGSPAFRTHVLEDYGERSAEVVRRERQVRSLAQYEAESATRDGGIRAAHASGHHSLKAIGQHFGLHYSTVSKICRLVAPGVSDGQAEETRVVNDRQFKT